MPQRKRREQRERRVGKLGEMPLFGGEAAEPSPEPGCCCRPVRPAEGGLRRKEEADASACPHMPNGWKARMPMHGVHVQKRFIAGSAALLRASGSGGKC